MHVHVFHKDGLGKKGIQTYSRHENQLPKHKKDLNEHGIFNIYFLEEIHDDQSQH